MYIYYNKVKYVKIHKLKFKILADYKKNIAVKKVYLFSAITFLASAPRETLIGSLEKASNTPYSGITLSGYLMLAK